jgi:ribosomal protein L7Ae-like RNA K-turn-binding protein
LAKKEKIIERNFGIKKEEVEEQIKKQIIQLIQLGWRSRIIKIGFDSTKSEIEKGKKGFLILAEDIANRTKRNILELFKGDYYILFTKEQLGSFIGKKNVGIIFIPETKFGIKLKNLIKQYLELVRR